MKFRRAWTFFDGMAPELLIDHGRVVRRRPPLFTRCRSAQYHVYSSHRCSDQLFPSEMATHE